MILNKKTIDRLNEFAEQNKHFENRVNMKDASSQLSKIFEFEVELSIDTRGPEEYWNLFAQGVSINLKTWESGIKSAPIDIAADACARLQEIHQNRDKIEEIMKANATHIDDWRYCQRLLSDIKWMQGRINHFFDYFSRGSETVDTETASKELFKIPIDKFEELGFYKSYKGKPDTREVYGRVFEMYAKCYSGIKFYDNELSLRMK